MSHSAEFSLASLVGQWSGTCKTWFEPGKLADESGIEGEFAGTTAEGFVKHTYRGTIKEKDRQGEELICRNAVTQEYQTSWIDSFHMNYAIMFSTGSAIDRGFSVTGLYDVGPESLPWGWRTEYQFVAADTLAITAYNVSPEGEAAKAIEVHYKRVGS